MDFSRGQRISLQIRLGCPRRFKFPCRTDTDRFGAFGRPSHYFFPTPSDSRFGESWPSTCSVMSSQQQHFVAGVGHGLTRRWPTTGVGGLPVAAEFEDKRGQGHEERLPAARPSHESRHSGPQSGAGRIFGRNLPLSAAVASYRSELRSASRRCPSDTVTGPEVCHVRGLARNGTGPSRFGRSVCEHRHGRDTCRENQQSARSEQHRCRRPHRRSVSELISASRVMVPDSR